MNGVKLILRESVYRLGEAGDLVDVKPGYARNYLLPQGKAILATQSRVKELEHHKRIVAERAAREMQSLTAVKDRLESLRLEVTARAGEEGKLFGSVTAAQVETLLAEQGCELDRRKISLSEPIKELGEHAIPIRLHRDLIAKVTLSVVAEGAPAEAPGEDAPETEATSDGD